MGEVAVALVLTAAVLIMVWPFLRLWADQRTPCARCGHVVANHVMSHGACLGEAGNGDLWCACPTPERRWWL